MSDADKNRVTDELRVFLESRPLYAATKIKTPGWGAGFYYDKRLWPDSMTRPCERCKLATTWSRTEGPTPLGPGVTIAFNCARCSSGEFIVWTQLRVPSDFDAGTMELRKLGQTPAWSIEVPKPMQDALPASALESYKRGLIMMSQSYGIAAVAYFRRVVEDVVERILDLMEEAAKLDRDHPDQAALDAIAEARRSHQATDRLELVADLVPAYLRPGGANPLSRLYASYSEGLHGLGDEECLEIATDLRDALDYLLPGLSDRLTSARAYQASLAKAGRRKTKPKDPAST